MPLKMWWGVGVFLFVFLFVWFCCWFGFPFEGMAIIQRFVECVLVCYAVKVIKVLLL